MGNTLLATIAAMAVLSAGLFVAMEKPEWLPDMPGIQKEPVLIFLVGDRRGIQMMKKAVHPDRVVAESPDAIALVEGRMMATNAEAVSAPLMAAGWGDRQIEIFTVARNDGLNRGGKGGGSASNDPRMGKLMDLMNKPTLSRGEALFVMQAMNDGLM